MNRDLLRSLLVVRLHPLKSSDDLHIVSAVVQGLHRGVRDGLRRLLVVGDRRRLALLVNDKARVGDVRGLSALA